MRAVLRDSKCEQSNFSEAPKTRRGLPFVARNANSRVCDFRPPKCDQLSSENVAKTFRHMLSDLSPSCNAFWFGNQPTLWVQLTREVFGSGKTSQQSGLDASPRSASEGTLLRSTLHRNSQSSQPNSWKKGPRASSSPPHHSSWRS